MQLLSSFWQPRIQDTDKIHYRESFGSDDLGMSKPFVQPFYTLVPRNSNIFDGEAGLSTFSTLSSRPILAEKKQGEGEQIFGKEEVIVVCPLSRFL
jgi:hypothetical protein